MVYLGLSFKNLTELRIIFAILSLCVAIVTEAQSLRAPVSSAYTLLNSYSTKQNDVFSFTNNSAALARQKGFSAGAYGENRFLIKEMNHYSAVANLPTSKGNFGLQADYFGDKNFNEYQLGFAYARPVGNNFDLGAQFNYYSSQIPGYQQASTVTFQLGAIARLSEVMSAGVQVYNPVGGYLSKLYNEKLSAIYQFGIGYEPAENVIISATAHKEEGRDLNITGGVFYHFDKRFFARAGINTGSNSPFGAAGIAFSDLRLDISVSHHPVLGFSPGVMIIYSLEKSSL